MPTIHLSDHCYDIFLLGVKLKETEARQILLLHEKQAGYSKSSATAKVPP
jgi:hypothetical protein